jgi:exo-beta-1,3-glucanase (GH17 family)
VIDAITVGSETLYRGNFTGPELLEKIQDVQRMFPKVRVGTADSWNKYDDGTADALIQGGVSYLYVGLLPSKIRPYEFQTLTHATASSTLSLSGRVPASMRLLTF